MVLNELANTPDELRLADFELVSVRSVVDRARDVGVQSNKAQLAVI
jgi:hypothetical protein